MANVRSRRQTKPKIAAPLPGSSRAVKKREDEDYVDERRKKKKKGTKLGVVKARSMSSLLGQDDNSNTNSSGATPATATVEAVGSDNVKESSTDEA